MSLDISESMGLKLTVNTSGILLDRLNEIHITSSNLEPIVTLISRESHKKNSSFN